MLRSLCCGLGVVIFSDFVLVGLVWSWVGFGGVFVAVFAEGEAGVLLSPAIRQFAGKHTET